MNTADLKAGDQVFFQSNVRYMNSNMTTVEKVGRKWIELSNGCRVERGKTFCDNRGVGANPGRVWANQAEFEEWRALSLRWARVRDHVRDTWNMPKHLAAKDLDELELIFRLNAEAS